MAFANPRKMTASPQRIADSTKRLLRKRYALKCETFKSVVKAGSERFRNRLGPLELRRQTNIEVIATHGHDFVRQQYFD